MTSRGWREPIRESLAQAAQSLRSSPLRSLLAVGGIVVGIVTVVMVASVLVNLRNQVALLFRELGTENVFAFHLTGDPYQPASDLEARRRPLQLSFRETLEREGQSIEQAAGQILVPAVIDGRALSARAGTNASDTVLVEGATANFFEVAGAEFLAGRPFTELEDVAGAPVAVLGAGIARALFGDGNERAALGRRVQLAGSSYTIVGVLAPRRGTFFGENRQDNVMSIPAGAAQRRFPQADAVVLYMRSRDGRLQEAYAETEAILRRLRRLPPEADSDFNLSTSEQIIRTFDQVGAAIGLATVALAAVSLLIGGIGVANVMVIAVVERTREIGIRRAVGARRAEIQAQFLFEAAALALAGGVGGLLLAGLVSLGLAYLMPGFLPVLPAWAVLGGLAASCLTGLLAGYLPARQAAGLDPVEALRVE